MYAIEYTSDGYKEIYATEEEWNRRIDYIAEVSSYDIDIQWERNTAVIDDGYPYDYYEEIEEYPDAY